MRYALIDITLHKVISYGTCYYKSLDLKKINVRQKTYMQLIFFQNKFQLKEE